MFGVGVLQGPPFFHFKTQTAVVITSRAHLGQDSRKHWVASKSHGGFEVADIILVFEHGLPDSMLFCLAFWLGKKRAHSWNQGELQRTPCLNYVRYSRVISPWAGIIFTAQIVISLPSIHRSNGKRVL